MSLFNRLPEWVVVLRAMVKSLCKRVRVTPAVEETRSPEIELNLWLLSILLFLGGFLMLLNLNLARFLCVVMKYKDKQI